MTISTESAEIEKKKHIRIALILTVIFACLLIIDFLTISLIFSWSDWIVTLIFSLLFIVPAYISNAGMVLVGGGRPIDGGKLWRDGKRILGDHKTWSGFIKGPLFIGIPISLGISCIFFLLWPIIQLIPSEGIQLGLYKIYDNLIFYEYYFIGGPFPIGIGSLFLRIVFCSYGAALGDLMGSFLKRRFNFESGAPFWIVDQLDFVVVAMIIASIPSFFFPTLYWSPDINIFIFLLLLTPSVSIFANSVAYLIGLKEVPW